MNPFASAQFDFKPKLERMPEDSSSCCAGGFYLLCNSTRLSAASYIQNMRFLCVCSNKSAFTASLNVEKPRVTLRRSHALLSRNLIIPRWRAGHRRLPIFKLGRGCSARMSLWWHSEAIRGGKGSGFSPACQSGTGHTVRSLAGDRGVPRGLRGVRETQNCQR